MAGVSEPGSAAAGVLAWSLFAIDLVAGLGWLALGALASRFRGSFGASRVAAGLVVVPALGFLVLACAAAWPDTAPLRWAATAIAALLALAALSLATKAPYLAGAALLHGVAWVWLWALYALG